MKTSKALRDARTRAQPLGGAVVLALRAPGVTEGLLLALRLSRAKAEIPFTGRVVGPSTIHHPSATVRDAEDAPPSGRAYDGSAGQGA